MSTIATPPEFLTGRFKDQVLSPFSAYYKGKTSISQASKPIQAVLPFVSVSQDGKLALVKNSKSGCTSLARSLYVYNHGEHFHGNIHKEGRHLQQGYSYWQKNWQALQNPETFTFSALRNPKDRVISAYFDFIVEKRNPIRFLHQSSFEHYDLIEISDVQQAFDRFLAFVEASILHDPWLTDRHWRPQYHNLWMEQISYKLIMRTEELDQGIKALRQMLQLQDAQFPLIHSNKRKDATDFEPSSTQLQKIEKIYTIDFESFEGLAQ